MKMFALVPVLVALLACGITETGNPELAVDLSLQARSSAPEQVDVLGPPGVTSVTGAWIGVDRVRFVRGAVCDGPGEQEIDVDGPFVRDAAAPIPEPIRATLPEGDYCRLRLRLEPVADPGAAPAELAGHVVLVTGVRADGVPWQIRSTEDAEADVRASAPIPLVEAAASLAVSLDVARWLEGIDLDALEPEAGLIRIEPGSHATELERFEGNFERALELFDDPD